MNGGISMKIDYSLRDQHDTNDIPKVNVSRSRSSSDDHRNLLNSRAPRPKLAQIRPVVGKRTDYVFKVMGSKVKVKVTVSSGGILIDRLPPKSIYFSASLSFLIA